MTSFAELSPETPAELVEFSRQLSFDFLCSQHPLIVEMPFWIGHVPFAWWLAQAHRPRLFVELGTYTGVSYSAFCAGLLESDHSYKSACVDTWKGDAHTGETSELVFNRFKTHHQTYYSRFSHMHRMLFDEALPHFSDGSIDLLNIDGCHSYEASRHDFETWLPKMSSRGIILFHDIAVRKEGFGVWRLWEELSTQYPSLAFNHSWGLGALAVGNEISQEVSWLFRSDSEFLKLIRGCFTHLGGVAHLFHVGRMSEVLQQIQSSGEKLLTSFACSPAAWLSKQTLWD